MLTVSGRYGSGSLFLRGRRWYLQFYRNGRCYQESAKTEDKSEALRTLQRRLGEVVTGKFAGLGPERARVQQLFDLLYSDHESSGRKSLYETKSRAKKHLEPFFGSIRCADLSSSDVDRYIRRRRAHAANGTINRELAILRRALALGRRHQPPLFNRELFVPSLPEGQPRQGFVDHEQYARLRAALPPHLQALFVTAYHVGCRKGELLSIRWNQVDLEGKTITLRGDQTKNSRPRVLPIYGEMSAWLEMQRSIRDEKHPACPWVFHRRGRQMQSFRKAWDTACKLVGLPGLLFHDLRRSAVRNMERAGIPRTWAMAISGHRTEAVYRRYAIVSEKDVRDAGRRLEAFLQEQAKPTEKRERAGELN